MSSLNVLPGLKAQDYTRSPLHGADCAWPEKNCYVDLFIELVHSLGLEPRAMLPFTLAMDFMGDQWTFFKPQHSEMRALYGIEVQEMNCWRPLIEHAREHLAAGRLIAVEANAHWMPDTVGTDYRRQHVKTTIMLTELDEASGRLAYFHNAGFYELSGEDFRQIFRLDAAPDSTHLPLFAELVRVDGVVRRTPAELAALAKPMLRQHLAWVPATNPIERFVQRFEQELPRLHERGLPYYHAWAFSTVRQLGLRAGRRAPELAGRRRWQLDAQSARPAEHGCTGLRWHLASQQDADLEAGKSRERQASGQRRRDLRPHGAVMATRLGRPA
jgi:hypothetical protein